MASQRKLGGGPRPVFTVIINMEWKQGEVGGKTFLEILGSFMSLPEGNWTLASFEHTLVVLGRAKIVHFRLSAVVSSES